MLGRRPLEGEATCLARRQAVAVVVAGSWMLGRRPPEGEATRLARRQAVEWWRLFLAMWIARGGLADDLVVVASVVTTPWFGSRGLVLGAKLPSTTMRPRFGLASLVSRWHL